MSLAELLALLGRAWSRLLLYPGGLAAVGALWLLGRLQGRSWAKKMPGRQDIRDFLALQSCGDWRSALSIGMPWLGLALVPLPLAAELARPLDVVVLLCLLEWPRLLAAGRELAVGQIARAAAMLNSYPPLILALLLMAHARGTFEAQTLFQAPSNEAALPVRLAFWAGALALLLVLPAALGIGPFCTAAPADRALHLGLKLRGLGIAALGLCPWAALVPEKMPWLLTVPLLLYCVLLWQFHRRSAGRAALPWARGLYWLSGGLLLLLLGLHVVGLLERIGI